jgi:hypothetical protein
MKPQKEKKDTRMVKTRNTKGKSPEPMRKVQEADEIQEEIIQEAPEKEEDSTTDKVSEMEEHEEKTRRCCGKRFKWFSKSTHADNGTKQI